MMMNTIGTVLKLTTFGESHGPAVGGVLDGCPAGLTPDTEFIASQLQRRKTGTSAFSSSRVEPDEVEFLSGLVNGTTIGTPIAFIVRNSGHHPDDYSALATLFRPSHADYAWYQKFDVSSGSGGGRTSARALLPVVVAGGFAEALLKPQGVSVLAWVSSIGGINCTIPTGDVSTEAVHRNVLNCPDDEATEKMLAYLKKLQETGDTAGGTVSCRISGVPAGWGEPMFAKLHAVLAHAMMSINSVKGFEYGRGFEAASMCGSAYNDALEIRQGRVRTRTNNDGGINGGISNGEDIFFRIALKPIPSIHLAQDTVDHQGKPAQIRVSGRHDTCAVPRSLPLVESLARLVVADHYLVQKIRKSS